MLPSPAQSSAAETATAPTLVAVCYKCALVYSSTEENPIDWNEGDEHECPQCKTMLPVEAEKHWMHNLIKARQAPMTEERRRKLSIAGQHSNHTGPTTERGRLIVSMNALKHGAHAKLHMLPAARKVQERGVTCQTCQFADKSVNAEGNGRCKSERWVRCMHLLPDMVELANAHSSGNPDAIRHLLADIQARGIYALRMSLDDIIVNGPTVEQVSETTQTRGEMIIESKQVRIEANPSVQGVAVLSRMVGGTNLADWNLTTASNKAGQQQDSVAALLDRMFSQNAPIPARRQPEDVEASVE